MNLWIRTQENSLCKVEDIIEPTCYDNKNWYLSAYTTRGRFVTLGIYESEKKALEVLDEIQGYIKLNIMMTTGIYHKMAVEEREKIFPPSNEGLCIENI